MFTGIVAAVGQITQASQHGDGLRLTIQAGDLDLSDVILGDSIAIQGACMTVVEFSQDRKSFMIDISAESLHKTVGLRSNAAVNLEKALRLSDRLGGHLVSGHVDGIGQVAIFEKVTQAGQASDGAKDNIDTNDTNNTSWHLAIDAPEFLAKYLAYKGSIVVNGTSLTVNQVEDLVVNQEKVSRVHINLIPHTLENTTLQFLKAGDGVNLEVDLIARYVERMLSTTMTNSTPTLTPTSKPN